MATTETDPMRSAACGEALEALQVVERRSAAVGKAGTALDAARRDAARACLERPAGAGGRPGGRMGGVGPPGGRASPTEQRPASSPSTGMPVDEAAAAASPVEASSAARPARSRSAVPPIEVPPLALPARTAPASPAIASPPPRVPTDPLDAITLCDAGGCWTGGGTRLNRVGPILWGPGGSACNVTGTVVRCP